MLSAKMKYFTEINEHLYLYLTDISEPEENELRLVIEEAKASGPEEDVKIGDKTIEGTRAILSTDDCAAYEVIFEDYIGYSVLNESYVSGDESEIFDGILFCIYSKSHYLDYISKGSFASADYPGPFKHYGFNCLNHIVDVASMSEPKIKRIRGRHLTIASKRTL
jgi:hypothetical protein